MSAQAQVQTTDFDTFIDAFECAWGNEIPDLASFLPPVENPLFVEVLRELIRIDLEHSWKVGRPTDIDEYTRRFPAILIDTPTLGAVSFEEYRQRRLAGESPSPEEYRRRFGIDTTSWPLGPPPSTQIIGRPDEAALRNLTLRGSDKDSAELDWTNSAIPGSAEYAHALADLYRSDGKGARRLAGALATLPRVDSEFVGFRLLAELGRGAFGCVFLAEPCQRSGGRVVLKVSADQFDDPPAQVFRHPHIVPREPSRRSGDLQAVEMPCRGNTTLGQLLQQLRKRAGADRQTTTPGEKDTPVDRFLALRPEKFIHKVLDIGCRLADALTHAHNHGVYHRNLKPSNVLLGDDDQPALIDFDLVTQTKWREHSAMSLVSGRLAYAAPEVLLKQQCSEPIDEGRSDVYALGAMLFELLTGSRPFLMRRGPLSDVLLALTEERRQTTPAARRLSHLVTPAAASILRRCVEPDPSRRTASARELFDELRNYVGMTAD
jgi:hypothetical protein